MEANELFGKAKEQLAWLDVKKSDFSKLKGRQLAGNQRIKSRQGDLTLSRTVGTDLGR